ncbi:hypothetical protein BST83_06345 [Polaribacter filamentus]|uniref:Helix-turn-helix domain-containing protein n=2 Tax=Polaribacter filamentus TaxID=53483 RepID=A0A2S7KVZ3_9FLAO|nr:hypothetical protein BST83_06345 [Polaribacter filamentus]
MAYLNVSRSTMYRLRKKQHIPSTKIGHSPMYPKCLLNTFLINRAIRNVKEDTANRLLPPPFFKLVKPQISAQKKRVIA